MNRWASDRHGSSLLRSKCAGWQEVQLTGPHRQRPRKPQLLGEAAERQVGALAGRDAQDHYAAGRLA